MIVHGDCLEEMRNMADNSVDSIVTDPPYGISFMNKHWDYQIPSVEIWREAMRVLKPGGHLLAFGGTRTYHRLAVNIEDAGFEIRDQIMWIYGSGFPKSMDVSKAIDKAAGAEREVVGQADRYMDGKQRNNLGAKGNMLGNNSNGVSDITAPATDAAKQWQGWGTALKPANEPIVVARKPLEKGLTVAQNVQKYGTGALNIDASRVEGGERPLIESKSESSLHAFGNGLNGSKAAGVTTQGRWPANVILNEEAGAVLDAQSGPRRSAGDYPSDSVGTGNGTTYLPTKPQGKLYSDSGGASRFFYCAKSSKRERNSGLENDTNGHPTVKPIALMEYLIRLVTPPQGTVLDPFAGSGSTLVAAKKLKFKFIGIERDADYHQIATKRVEALA